MNDRSVLSWGRFSIQYFSPTFNYRERKSLLSDAGLGEGEIKQKHFIMSFKESGEFYPNLNTVLLSD